jgi:hypothetical protein
MNHKGRDIAELNTLYVGETVGSNAKSSMPALIAMPRIAPMKSSASSSAFQESAFEVTRRAKAITGAIEPCARNERIAQFK